MMSLRGGIPSPIVVSFSIDTNTYLFDFATILNCFFPFLIHASIFLLVGQLNLNFFNTIVVILIDNMLFSPYKHPNIFPFANIYKPKPNMWMFH